MTPSKEDYLKMIVELGGREQTVSNKDLSHALNVKAASVSDMNSKLVEEGLITHIPYKGVQVTDKGFQIAMHIIRKHRIWEVFLHDKLHYGWDEVHHHADLLEHASSDELIDRLYEFLGQPEFDPHGAIIPKKDGSSSRPNFSKLSELESGQAFIFRQSADESELLKYLTKKNFQLNGAYLLLEKNPYDGQLSLEDQEGRELTLSPEAASQIDVEIQ